MIPKDQTSFDKLETLPSLRPGWVRLVHRCISSHGHIENIKNNGLVFNRQAAGLSPNEAGGCYTDITAMASVYDEKAFWESMKKDDFEIFDNARYADSKLIWDMPLEEFCLLESFGRVIGGKIPPKYYVGCVLNVNGANKALRMSREEIEAAAEQSRKNPPSKVDPNDVDKMIKICALKRNPQNPERLEHLIRDALAWTKEDILHEYPSLKNTSTPLKTYLKPQLTNKRFDRGR